MKIIELVLCNDVCNLTFTHGKILTFYFRKYNLEAILVSYGHNLISNALAFVTQRLIG